jgi:hypothetical protein
MGGRYVCRTHIEPLANGWCWPLADGPLSIRFRMNLPPSERVLGLRGTVESRRQAERVVAAAHAPHGRRCPHQRQALRQFAPALFARELAGSGAIDLACRRGPSRAVPASRCRSLTTHPTMHASDPKDRHFIHETSCLFDAIPQNSRPCRIVLDTLDHRP